MATNNRDEYEAFFILSELRHKMGDHSLEAVIREAMTPALEIDREHGGEIERPGTGGDPGNAPSEEDSMLAHDAEQEPNSDWERER